MMRPAVKMRGPITSPSATRFRRMTAASVGAPGSRTVVIPCASRSLRKRSVAARSNCGRMFPSLSHGCSSRCACISTKPGKTNFPVASITSASAGMSAGLSRAIFPSRISIVQFSFRSRFSPKNAQALRSTRTFASADPPSSSVAPAIAIQILVFNRKVQAVVETHFVSLNEADLSRRAGGLHRKHGGRGDRAARLGPSRSVLPSEASRLRVGAIPAR